MVECFGQNQRVGSLSLPLPRGEQVSFTDIQPDSHNEGIGMISLPPSGRLGSSEPLSSRFFLEEWRIPPLTPWPVMHLESTPTGPSSRTPLGLGFATRRWQRDCAPRTKPGHGNCFSARQILGKPTHPLHALPVLKHPLVSHPQKWDLRVNQLHTYVLIPSHNPTSRRPEVQNHAPGWPSLSKSRPPLFRG